MKVEIREREYHYESDFPEGWKYSRGDYFKFPVEINSYKCFIKRFDRPTKDIPGWELLKELKGRYERNLPRIYDVITENEDDKNVLYVFHEFIEGQTLDSLISKKFEVKLTELTDDLFNALQAIHKRGFWYADFIEKNIFCDKSGRFFLIDLDSTQPESSVPDTDMWGSKEYWGLVFKYCTDVLHSTAIKPSHFNGISFNYLHAIFLILRLKIFSFDVEREYYSSEFFNHLPVYLNRASSSFKNLFDKIIQNKNYVLNEEEVTEIKNLIKEKIINLSHEEIDAIVNREEQAPDEPLINDFTVNNFSKKREDDYIIKSGKSFTLTWDVQNASHIELYRNGAPFKRLNSGQKNIQLTEEAFEDEEKKMEYKLFASNGSVQTHKTIIVDIVPDLPELAIKEFNVSSYIEKNGNEYTIQSGKTFRLKWDTQNIKRVELYKNGEPYKTLDNDQKNIELKEEVHDSRTKSIEYTLVGSNNEESVTKSLLIKVVFLKPVINEFTIQNFFEKNKDDYIIENGKSFILKWEVLNASQIELYKNNELCKKINENEKNIELTEEVFDANSKKIEYTLVASNQNLIERKLISVKIIYPAPVINQFNTNKHLVKQGKSFKLMWDVQNASVIKLYQNGEFYREISPNEKNIELRETLYDGKKTEKEYTLWVSNQFEEIQSEPVIVTLRPPGIPPRRIALFLVIPLFAIVLLLALYYYLNKTSVYFTGKQVNEEDTITIAGKNLPVNDGAMQVVFVGTNTESGKGDIIRQTKNEVYVRVPPVADRKEYVDISVYINGNLSEVFKKVLYVPKTPPTVFEPRTPSPFLNEIWYDKKNNQYLNINLSKNIVYYSLNNQNNYVRDSIRQTYQNSAGVNKIIVGTNNKYNVLFIRNISPQSFEFCKCNSDYKTIEETKNIDETCCNNFSVMEPYYENNSKIIYLPVSGFNLASSEKSKLSFISDSMRRSYILGYSLKLVSNKTFLDEVKLSDISKYLSDISIPPYAKSATNNSSQNPFQRNYLTVSFRITPRDHTGTITEKPTENPPHVGEPSQSGGTDLGYIEFDSHHYLDNQSIQKLNRIVDYLVTNRDSKITLYGYWENEDDKEIVSENLFQLKNFYIDHHKVSLTSPQVDTKIVNSENNMNVNRIVIRGINFPPDF